MSSTISKIKVGRLWGYPVTVTTAKSKHEAILLDCNDNNPQDFLKQNVNVKIRWKVAGYNDNVPAINVKLQNIDTEYYRPRRAAMATQADEPSISKKRKTIAKSGGVKVNDKKEDIDEDKKPFAVTSGITIKEEEVETDNDEEMEKPDAVSSSSLVQIKSEDIETDSDSEMRPSAVTSGINVKEEVEIKTSLHPSPVASAAISREYDEDTDDDNDKAVKPGSNAFPSPIVSSAPIKTEPGHYDQSTDEEDEEFQAEMKLENSNDLTKILVQAREATDQLVHLGRHDGTLLAEVEQFSTRLQASIEKVKQERQDDPVLLQRQNGLKVMVRNSDNINAEHQLAYLDYVDNGGDEGEYVWVRFDANIEERVRVKKSRIDNIQKVYRNVYAWCEGPTLQLMSYGRFLFWRRLFECKTYGEIRALSRLFYEGSDYSEDDDEFMNEFMGRNINQWVVGDNIPDDLTDDIRVVFDIRGNDSGYDDNVLVLQPPLIENIMSYEEDYLGDRWMWSWAKKDTTPRSRGTREENMSIDNNKKCAIFEDMAKHGRAVIHCPQLDKMFRNLIMKICVECGERAEDMPRCCECYNTRCEKKENSFCGMRMCCEGVGACCFECFPDECPGCGECW